MVLEKGVISLVLLIPGWSKVRKTYGSFFKFIFVCLYAIIWSIFSPWKPVDIQCVCSSSLSQNISIEHYKCITNTLVYKAEQVKMWHPLADSVFQLQEVLLSYIANPQLELALVMLIVPFVVNVSLSGSGGVVWTLPVNNPSPALQSIMFWVVDSLTMRKYKTMKSLDDSVKKADSVPGGSSEESRVRTGLFCRFFF